MHLSKLIAIAALAAFPSLSNGEDAALCESMLADHPECNNYFFICNEAFESCSDRVSTQQEDGATNATNATVLCETLVCLDNGTFFSLEDDAQPSMEDDTMVTNGTSSLEDDLRNSSMEDDTAGGANAQKTSQAPSAFGMFAATAFTVAAGLSLIA